MKVQMYVHTTFKMFKGSIVIQPAKPLWKVVRNALNTNALPIHTQQINSGITRLSPLLLPIFCSFLYRKRQAGVNTTA